jgi:predicted patatin/cPLA2 family phospholipase
MPIVSKIVEIDGQKLLDGGISDSVPIKQFEKMGYDKNVVVLTQMSGYRKRKCQIMPLVKMKYKKYPAMVSAMAKRHIGYNETMAYIDEKEQRGELFVIRPEGKLPVSKVEKDPEKLKKAYQMGRDTAIRRLAELKEYLSR